MIVAIACACVGTFFFLMLGVRGIRGPRHLECARGKGKGALFT